MVKSAASSASMRLLIRLVEPYWMASLWPVARSNSPVSSAMIEVMFPVLSTLISAAAALPRKASTATSPITHAKAFLIVLSSAELVVDCTREAGTYTRWRRRQRAMARIGRESTDAAFYSCAAKLARLGPPLFGALAARDHALVKIGVASVLRWPSGATTGARRWLQAHRQAAPCRGGTDGAAPQCGLSSRRSAAPPPSSEHRAFRKVLHARAQHRGSTPAGSSPHARERDISHQRRR